MSMIPILAGVVAAALGLFAALAVGRRAARTHLAAARAESAALLRGAKLEAAALQRAAATAAREDALAEREAKTAEIDAAGEAVTRRAQDLAVGEAQLDEARAALDGKWAGFREAKRTLQSMEDSADHVRGVAEKLLADAQAELEARAGETGAAMGERLAQRWIEDAQAAAANRLRSLDTSGADPEVERAARRIMGIAGARYKEHFLTERLISNVPLLPGVAESLTAADGLALSTIAKVAGVQLNLAEDGSTVRLEGLDGVGREIARRALARLGKPRPKDDAVRDAEAWVVNIKEHLEREIFNLGKKAFAVLEIERAHPEIVELVGKLNYRTSYTQNQWRHAVEASFIAGMMASELGLDVRLARRATLMHDIGKALTHEIDGSHAVIGAEIARRLGEPEAVANAIGAHHADEPPGTVYAYLVAAADAMSGARPGARRQLTVEYGTRIEDLERIGRSYRGVDRCFAVHGGRELRVYVEEGALSDLEAVELSATIARRVSDELTFPGQIKVTIIRAYEAVSVAS
jgi:ribonuclease Y